MFEPLPALSWSIKDHLPALMWSAVVLGIRFRTFLTSARGAPWRRRFPSLTDSPTDFGEAAILIWALTETWLTHRRLYSAHAWLSEVLLASLVQDLLYSVIVVLLLIAADFCGRALWARSRPAGARLRRFRLSFPALLAVAVVLLDRSLACILWSALVAKGLE